MVSDNWTDVLYSAMYAQFDFAFGVIYTAIFFIFVYVLTHSILVDLAVAVILENFELDEDEKRYGQVVQLVERLERRTFRADASYLRYLNECFFHCYTPIANGMCSASYLLHQKCYKSARYPKGCANEYVLPISRTL